MQYIVMWVGHALRRTLVVGLLTGALSFLRYWLDGHPSFNVHTGGFFYLTLVVVSAIGGLLLIPGWLMLNLLLGMPKRPLIGALSIAPEDPWLLWAVGNWITSWLLWIILLSWKDRLQSPTKHKTP